MSKKILIVDDEPHIRLLLEQTLEDFEDEGVELVEKKPLEPLEAAIEVSGEQQAAIGVDVFEVVVGKALGRSAIERSVEAPGLDDHDLPIARQLGRTSREFAQGDEHAAGQAPGGMLVGFAHVEQEGAIAGHQPVEQVLPGEGGNIGSV